MANTDLPFEQEVTDPVTTSIENARRRFNEEFFIKPSTYHLTHLTHIYSNLFVLNH